MTLTTKQPSGWHLRTTGQPLITTDAVLLEVGNALARGYRQEAVGVIRELRSSDQVEIVGLTRELMDAALDQYRTHADKDWGLVDCFSFALMRERGLTDVLTFHRHFIQAGFRALLRPDA